MKIHHIGYLVSDIKNAVHEFSKLGFIETTGIIFDAERKINIIFMNNDAYNIELVEPTKDCILFSNTMKKIGNTPYHICYTTDNFDCEIEILSKNSFLVKKPQKAIALDNKRVAFFMNAEIGLFEVLES